MKKNKNKTLNDIIKYDLDLFSKIIKDKKDKIKNLIIFAHDPIVTFRCKQNEEKKSKKSKSLETSKTLETLETLETVKKTNALNHNCTDKNKNPGIVTISKLNDDGIKFLRELYNLCDPSIKKYYICADTHQYQKAKIKFGDIDVEQHVVGTGGADLDIDAFTFPILNHDTQLNYELEESIPEKYGYLICKNTNGNLDLSFIEVKSVKSDDQIKVSGIKKKHTKKKKKKQKRTHIQKYRERQKRRQRVRRTQRMRRTQIKSKRQKK